MSGILVFWGKTGNTKDGVTGAKPVVHHLLDVAAVAYEFANLQPAFVARLSGILDIPSRTVAPLLAFLAGLHDLGKFSVPFQAKSEGHWPAPLLGPFVGTLFDAGHWRYTAALMSHDGPVASHLKSLFPAVGEKGRLIAAVAGHHGIPPEPEMMRHSVVFEEKALTPPCLVAAGEATKALAEITGIEPLPNLKQRNFDRADFLFSGLITLCDWIGSDTEYFPIATRHEENLQIYWEAARLEAKDALKDKGQIEPSILVDPDYIKLGLPCAGQPRPVQALIGALPIAEGPQLYILEDTTGSGKTEAALLLAARLMAAGKGEGIYFALPTMATANAMYERMGTLRQNLFTDGEASLVLAHGKAALARKLSILRSKDTSGDTAAGFCNAWIADSRRLALFAEIGVGTVDQAFLGVLRKKYLALRHAALARRILVIDEAHSFDAYMGKELEVLLEAQAQNGGSAIVLSATLSSPAKKQLARAFRQGLPETKRIGLAPVGGWQPVEPDWDAVTALAYPMLASISRGGLAVHAVEFDSSLRREVGIVRCESRDAAVSAALAAAAKGAAVGIVCNAVDEAISVHERIAAGLADPDHAQLFHARFALGDRMRIERDVLDRFGKTADGGARRGRVLVGTQVIEQSLDIDFDLLITDLAPVDLLIQRAGRLWRHMGQRPAETRPLASPVMMVVSPDPAGCDSQDWLKSVLGKAAHVYQDPAVMWRSAKVMFDAGALRVPDDLRSFVESVYGDSAIEFPECLKTAAIRAKGAEGAHRSLGTYNTIDLAAGYLGLGGKLSSDEMIGTRLGEPTVTIRLAKEANGRLAPLFDEPGADEALNWALSEITLRQSQWQRIAAHVLSGPKGGSAAARMA